MEIETVETFGNWQITARLGLCGPIKRLDVAQTTIGTFPIRKGRVALLVSGEWHSALTVSFSSPEK